MEFQQFFALAVFLGVYALFATKVVHRTVAALLGAALWVIQGPGAALSWVIPDVLLVTAGLMVLGGYMKRSGLAEWLALKTARAGNGRPTRIMILTGLLSFFLGAALGPVAAVVLVLPVSLLLAVELDVPTLPVVVVLSWTSLLGGATTLTAQPGNLWVGTTLGLDGATWALQMLPYTGAALVLTLVLGVVLFRKSLRVTNERRARVLEFDASRSLEDRSLLAKTVTVLLAVVAGLVAGPWLSVGPSVVVVGGVIVLWLWDGPSSVERSLSDIDGATLLFYGGLLIVIGAWGASTLSQVVASSVPANPWLVLWGSAVLGAFVDHGAVVGALVPTLQVWSPGLVWPFVVLGSSLGAGATVWGALSTSTALGLAGPRRPALGPFLKFGLLFLVLNLALVSGLMFFLVH